MMNASRQHLSSMTAQNILGRCTKINGLYFIVKHLTGPKKDRKIRLQNLTRQNANEVQFEIESGGTMQRTSVAEYFYKTYKIELQYPQLPMAHTRFGYFPLELCFTAEGERYKEVLQGQETADFIKFATAPASVRRSQISHCLRILAHHDNMIMAAHGLHINNQMMDVP
jgi:eukaryotic translation initiation factor 2C